MRSIDLVARKYGVDRKTVWRKIRLTYLIPQLYELGERMGYSQKMMIALSYLPQVVQTNVVQAVVIENIILTETIAAALRSAAESADLTINDVLRICREHGSTADTGKRTRTVRYEVPETLFPTDLPAKQRPDYIAAALSYIRTHQIELEIH